MALAFFGLNGEFHSLTDLSGKSYYNSRELVKVVSPQISINIAYRKHTTSLTG
ncbi:MAG: hypothetical protein WB392_08140 [Methanotrichaceae archaeon]